MTAQPVTATLTGGVELLERAITYTRSNLQLITPGDLTDPTPCHGWDLAALLAHMEDSLDALCEAADFGRIDLDDGADRPCIESAAASDVCVRLRTRAIRLLNWSATALGDEPIAIAERPLTASIVTATGALEITAHGWDVAQACGTDRPIPEELAEELLAVAPLLITDADRPARFAAPRDVPESAAAGHRLLAFLGREARG
ncbi:TIGR03086 family metal-binding protein [Phytoactinopolyspora halotolerans]|uniref:TIGR03086 family protein n=1 Tax=Phytoactinopolyspora halotolerans TaxID=1981512 RepID=A0A6L9SGN2_9ACTN|nr:TIGR03086 family metal-binding protein [Phytoactinopolyspora halotolerans]NEE04436.1 TIGR03086 family protein [Phytoactinopolyspora halotolerans]